MKKYHLVADAQFFRYPGTEKYTWTIEISCRDIYNPGYRKNLVTMEKFKISNPDELTGLHLAIRGYEKIFNVPVKRFYTIAPGVPAENHVILPTLQNFLLLGLSK